MEGVVVGLTMTVGVMTIVFTTTLLTVVVTWTLCVGSNMNMSTCQLVILPWCVVILVAVVEDVVMDPMMIVGVMISARRLVTAAVMRRRCVPGNLYLLLMTT